MRFPPRSLLSRTGARTLAGGVLAIVGVAMSLHAQRDSVRAGVRLALGAGPVGVISPRQASSLGYTLQGSVIILPPAGVWSVRGDLIYQHVGPIEGGMERNADGSYRMRGTHVEAGAALVDGVVARKGKTGARPFALVGVGVAVPSAMNMTSGTADGAAGAGPALQWGAGLEWGHGPRALFVEARLQALRAGRAASWYTTVPLTLGVSF